MIGVENREKILSWVGSLRLLEALVFPVKMVPYAYYK